MVMFFYQLYTLIFSVLDKIFAGKSMSIMTYIVSSGTLTSVNQRYIVHASNVQIIDLY